MNESENITDFLNTLVKLEVLSLRGQAYLIRSMLYVKFMSNRNDNHLEMRKGSGLFIRILC